MQKKITIKDNVRFAELSGDFNPMHVDPLEARRYLYGRPVVHGIHILLWVLNVWLSGKKKPLKISRLHVDFLRPCGVEEELLLSICQGDDGTLSSELSSGESIVAKMEWKWEPYIDNGSQGCALLKGLPENPMSCRTLSKDDLELQRGKLQLYVDKKLLHSLFPEVDAFLPIWQSAALLASTRLVGMECPGLNSIYSELDLSFSAIEQEETLLSYEVTKYDRRFDHVSMGVKSPGMKGTVMAFYRPSPPKQPSIEEIKSKVEPGEFIAQRAVIIGGTRGLGEVTAKLLVAGGAAVKISYCRGKVEADNILCDIETLRGDAEAFRFNVLESDKERLIKIVEEWKPTHLYYFATPFIFSSVKGCFSPSLFNKFCDYYVTGFHDTVIPFIKGGLKKIFYPSTIAIDELPLNMGEYVSAKSAGESLCSFLEKRYDGLVIARPRLPRLDTDQTASLHYKNNIDPVPEMLKYIKSMS